MYNKNAEQTNKNIAQYLAVDKFFNRFFIAPVSRNFPGWITKLGFPNRTYFEHFIVDEEAELMYIELSIDVVCLKAYRMNMSNYLDKINSETKTGKVCVDKNGHVYVHCSQYFKDNPIGIETIMEMERNVIAIAEEYGERIQLAANGYPVVEDEDRVNEIFRRLLAKRMKEETDDSDNTDNPDDSDKLVTPGNYARMIDNILSDIKFDEQLEGVDSELLIDDSSDESNGDLGALAQTTMEDTMKSIMESESEQDDDSES